MLGSLFGVLTGLFWGFGIYFSGKASRKVSPYLLTAIYNIFGFIFFTFLFIVTDEKVAIQESANSIIPKTIFAGAIGGIGLSAGILLISKGLSNGRAGILGPLTATASAIASFIYIVATGEWPNVFAVVGIFILFFVPWFVSKTDSVPIHVNTTVSRDIFFSIGSGLGFAISYVALIYAPDEAQYLVMMLLQLTSGTVLFIAHALSSNSWSVPKEIRFYACIFIIFEILGAMFLRLSINEGPYTSVLTLASIFDPIGLLIMARFLGKETFSKHQLIGFLFMVIGVALVVPNS